MKTTVRGIRISGIAAAIPAQRVELRALGQEFVDRDCERVIQSTGISAVRIARGLKASDLCAAAARALLRDMRVDAESIDALVFVSQTPDRVMPATSCGLQQRLGLGSHIASFDIQSGCAGYMYGLLQAALLVGAGCKRVLLCAGDVISPLLHPDDWQVRMLFGDAGSATLVERGESAATFVVHTDGRGQNEIIVPRADELELCARLRAQPGYLHMNGVGVLVFALHAVPRVLDELLTERGWASQDVGLYGLHQANQIILQYLRDRLQLDQRAVPQAIEDTGNTGSASIPLLLAEVGHRYAAAQLAKTALCGFGVGLSWGAAAVDLSTTRFLPRIEVTEHEGDVT